MRSRASVAVLLAAMAAVTDPAQAVDPVLTSVQAVGSGFLVTISDGRRLRGAQLVGAVLSIPGPSGMRRIRIDAVEIDAADRDRDIHLHRLSVQDPATGLWADYCQPGPDGVAGAFPLSGS